MVSFGVMTFSSFQTFYCIPFSCKTGAAKQLTSVEVNGAP